MDILQPATLLNVLKIRALFYQTGSRLKPTLENVQIALKPALLKLHALNCVTRRRIHHAACHVIAGFRAILKCSKFWLKSWFYFDKTGPRPGFMSFGRFPIWADNILFHKQLWSEMRAQLLSINTGIEVSTLRMSCLCQQEFY